MMPRGENSSWRVSMMMFEERMRLRRWKTGGVAAEVLLIVGGKNAKNNSRCFAQEKAEILVAKSTSANVCLDKSKQRRLDGEAIDKRFAEIRVRASWARGSVEAPRLCFTRCSLWHSWTYDNLK